MQVILKRTLTLLLLPLLFAACKKEKKPAPAGLLTYNNIQGTWTLSSYKTNFGAGANASVAQYPCMAYNTLTFYRDSTSSQSYTGADSCFITASHLKADGAQIFGLPGLGPQPSTWSLKGGVLHIFYTGNPNPVTGAIASVNNQLELTLTDTLQGGSNTYYTNSVLIKQ